MGHIQADVYMLGTDARADGQCAGNGCSVVNGNAEVGSAGHAAFAVGKMPLVVAGVRSLPSLCQPHCRFGIDIAEAVVVAGVHAAAVPVAGGVPYGVGVGVVDFPGADGEDLLDVAPAEFGVGFEHQGNDSADDGGGEAGALDGAAVVAECGAVVAHQDAAGAGDVGAGRGNQDGCAGVAERRLADGEGGDVGLGVNGAGNDDGAVGAQGVGVGVAAVLPVVAACHDDGGAESASTLGDGIKDALFDGTDWCYVDEEVICGSPTVVDDVVVFEGG